MKNSVRTLAIALMVIMASVTVAFADLAPIPDPAQKRSFGAIIAAIAAAIIGLVIVKKKKK